MHLGYYINPKKGIYRIEKAYHDDVDYVYEVDFDKPEPEKQFQFFLNKIHEAGKKARTAEIQSLFTNK